MQQGYMAEHYLDLTKDRPDVVAAADVEYERILRRDAAAKSTQEGRNYFDTVQDDRFKLSSFEYTYMFMSNHVGNDYDMNPQSTILQHKSTIDRCFNSDSLEEIMANLEAEDTEFSRKTLQRMKSNSELSMKLALKMVRKAKNLCYGEAIKMESNVALNKINDTDFKIGVERVL